MTTRAKGVVAAGHPVTAEAARTILQAGGNAFDAAIGALLASCVAEPILASLGGGGFLLAHPIEGPPRVFDFFTQTPRKRRPPQETDFHPILADFGTAQQEFHIGMGSMATPGVVAGIFAVHAALGRMPLETITEPARSAALVGVKLNAFQHYIASIIAPILHSSPAARALHAGPRGGGELAREGDLLRHAELAATLEALPREGPGLFYRGELAARLAEDSRTGGGHLTRQDLASYRVELRSPLSADYRGAKILTNPPPSLGGTLIALALALMELRERNGQDPQSVEHLMSLARTMYLIQQLRRNEGIDRNLDARAAKELLSKDKLQPYLDARTQGLVVTRGTTQISVADSDGNLASLTLSNGEGCGYVLPDTGIMLNNMLGEEDINPGGFQTWTPDRRLASMMAPTLVFSQDGKAIALGSGGSNRIRSAILQVLINLLDHGQTLEQAVEAPRIHFEDDTLHVEIGPSEETLKTLDHAFPNRRIWPDHNLFFGGAHAVMVDHNGRLAGQGDSRRGGVSLLA
jgi:gamma-glutamyltranspeptidase/glutathione hydrolase